ncbi:armadillo-type protein [Thermothelomyces heterothallicus CBS 202.75]|uniref:armadillo-type protein n=1 Tax=Thermothelomyces heterothallicus CBS 202.75 TaxID=1149848 RepID=UPI0037425B99
MTRFNTPPILSQIRAARSYSEQAAALRLLKDDIIGHVNRKEEWIQNGILNPLVEILRGSVRSPTGSTGQGQSQAEQSDGLSEEDEVRLLALQIIASFAYGNAAFLAPLHAVDVVSAIVPTLSPANYPPPVVLTALRALRNIAASAELAVAGANDIAVLSNTLFSSNSLAALYAILSQESADAVVQEQKRLVASLVSTLCRNPKHQNALADAGVLDALATMLASFAAARGEVIPGAEVIGQRDGLAHLIPAPAAPNADLALTLAALSAIVANSRFRSYMLLCSPAILAVFPPAEFSPLATPLRAAWDALEVNGFGSVRNRDPGAMDYLIPAVPIPSSISQSRGFGDYPPLGFSVSRDNLATGSRTSTFRFTGVDSSRPHVSGEDEEADEPESPLIPWLIHLVRSTNGLAKVMAASLVTSLFKAGFASPEREQMLAVLVVPPLWHLMKEHDKEIPASVQQAAFVEPGTAMDWAIMERTIDVLARLVGESNALQQAVHDCGVIKMLAKLLKESCEPRPAQFVPRLWSAKPISAAESEEGSPACRLGPAGLLPAYAHRIRMRESALKLVASMATLSNDYREALAEADVVPYIMKSLSPYPGNSKEAKDQPSSEKAADNGDSGKLSAQDHNPNSVIVAACHAIRALARSPKIVRTTLRDHDAAAPLNQLLRHPDAEVQIAASGAVINIVTSHNDVVAALLDLGLYKTLCEHAHSLNPGLRLNALWALKHLALNLDNAAKKACLEELEPGWLVQLISDDASDEEGLGNRSRSERRSTDADEDEDMDADTPYEGDDDAQRAWTWPALTHNRGLSVNASPRLQQAVAKLTALRDAELNPARRARADSLAIQEQGLGFIRNLLMITDPSGQADMVDHLFTEIGQDRLFAILTDKLKVRVVGAANRRASSRDALVLYPQARIVENLAYILVNMAAGAPRHRQLVVAQTELLKLLGGHLSSKDPGVRMALCQLLANLAWVDCESDRAPSSQRTAELERLGFLAKLEGMEAGDADFGVRERAKAAVSQMKAPTL